MKRRIWRADVLLLALTIGMGGLPSASQAFELNGFGDVTFTNKEADTNNGDNNGFALGQLDFYVAEQVSDRLDVLAEFVIESPGEGFVVDLERLQIGYAFNNNHKLRAGRFHNLLGYWNLAFHHGAQLQTTVGRPFFLEFEDENGVVPVHMVGVWWDSKLNTGAGRVDLGVMFGNGASITGDGSGPPVELNPDSGGDSDNDKAVSARIAFSPAAVRGLSGGVSGQFGTINIVGVGGSVTDDQVDQIIWVIDLEYLANNIEALGEYYAWDHDFTGGTSSSSAYYVQLGYLVNGVWTPYIRYESLDAENDPYFDAVGMTTGTDRQKNIALIGVRYDLNYRSALKAEWRAIDDDYDGSFNEGAVQWSFSF
jgi:hypothetical protein